MDNAFHGIGNLDTLCGMNVFFSPSIVKFEDKEVEIKRTIRERYFSFPWKPWVKTKMVVMSVPVPTAYIAGNNLLIHSLLKSEFERQVALMNGS